MAVTDGHRERAEELIPHEAFCVLWLARGKQCQCKDRGVVLSFVAAALAEEREKALAPVLALADELGDEADGLRTQAYRSVGVAFAAPAGEGRGKRQAADRIRLAAGGQQ